MLQGVISTVIQQLFIFLFLFLLPACGPGKDDDNPEILHTSVVTLHDGGKYSESDTIWFNWVKWSEQKKNVVSYRLEVRDENDVPVFDREVGNVLSYKIKGTEGQTLTARVAAIDDAGEQLAWSDFSDGITLCGKYLGCLAGTHFVSVNGSDTNDGLTPDTPFFTINKAVSVAGPGDVIDVAAGTYKEGVFITKIKGHGGDSDSPLVLRGSGKAIIEGSKPLNNWDDHGLVKTGTGPCRLWSTYFNPNDYPDLRFQDGIKRAPTQLFMDGNTRLDLLPEPINYYNGNALTEEETQNEDLIASQFRPNSWAWVDSSKKVYLCLSDGDPVTDHLIEIPVRNVAIFSDTGYLHITGFVTRRQAAFGIIAKGNSAMKEVVIANNDVGYISGSREYTDSDLGPQTKVWGNGVGILASLDSQATIISNHVHDISYSGIRFARSVMASSQATHIRISDNIIERITPHPFGVNRAHESGEGIAGSNGSTYDLIENNRVTDVKYGIWFDSPYDSPVGGTGNATVVQNKVSKTMTAIFFERAARNVIANRNLVTNAKYGIKLGTSGQYGQEPDIENPRFDARNSRIINNTMIDSDVGIYLDYASHTEIYNNIVYSEKNQSVGILIGEGTVTINDYLDLPYGDINSNLYYLTASDKLGCWIDKELCYPDVCSWQTQSGFDIDSIHSHPKFINHSGGDYSLSQESPAIDSGLITGLEDYCNLPDLGYIEYLTDDCL